MRKFLLVLFVFLKVSIAFSQVEYVNPDEQVYNLLKEMQVRGVISGYNSSFLPLSREEISKYLNEILSSKILSNNDRSRAEYFLTEYDTERNIREGRTLFRDNGTGYLFSHRPSYLYLYSDSTVNFFLNGLASIRYTRSTGDSIENAFISSGSMGMEVRGTFENTLGFYLHAVNTAKLNSNIEGRELEIATDKRAASDWKFLRGENFYSYFEGYLRYRNSRDWFSLSIGRFPVEAGFGYINKLFISDNASPFDLIKTDLKYKRLSYTFFYGAIRGDSLGRKLNSKNIAFHRLSYNISNRLKFGFTEAVITADAAFNLSLLNPISVLTVAELNKASQGQDDNINNGILGFDIEYIPFNDIAFQGSLLIDDIDFSKLFKPESKITNKFGYQIGMMWSNIMKTSLNFAIEYTKLDPFVYTHTSNKSNYTHWNLPIGHSIPPNSDEIAIKFLYNYKSIFFAEVESGFIRHGEGIITDTTGRLVVNYGGNIDNGRYNNIAPEFLGGDRTNITWGKLSLAYLPVRNLRIKFDYHINVLERKYIQEEKTFNYLKLGIDVRL